MEEYLSDIEKEKIERFCEDEVLVEAVKKVLLAPIYSQGVLVAGRPARPLNNGALALAFDRKVSAEELGNDVKAFAQGVNHIETGFQKLAEIKGTPAPKTDKKNVNKAK
jgi:hypothetical protein